MTDVTEQQSGRERRTIYIVAGIVVLALVVVGLFTHSAAQSSEAADQKATQLIAALAAAGAATPDKDQVVSVLGDDGGATCEDPAGALSQATLLGQLMNGASGPGMRPVIADDRVVKGQLLIIEIYCPDELTSFQEFVDGLNLDETVNG
ncbi:hypothetical protein IF650_08805 [Cellulosimicrobium terreum]|nr:hypothetical protein [Cellulosimicrobium terreum]